MLIDCIVTKPGETAAGFATLGDGTKSIFEADRTITALTDCTVIAIPIVKLQNMLNTPEISAIYRDILTGCTETHLRFSTQVLSLNARERIQWLIDNEPHIINQMQDGIIPKQDIASYLRITPQSFGNNWKRFEENQD